MKPTLFIIVAGLLILSVPECTLAQVTFSNPIVFGSVQGLITAFVRALVVMLIPVVVFFVIYAGFLYVTGRGNPAAITKASQSLLYALIGGVVIIGAFAILGIVENTVNGFRARAMVELISNLG